MEGRIIADRGIGVRTDVSEYEEERGTMRQHGLELGVCNQILHLLEILEVKGKI